MGATRIAIGATVGGSTGMAARLFGAPADQVTPTARLLARLFGVRQVVLGAWVLTMRDASDAERRRCFQLNACVDMTDIAVLVPYLLRRGLRRAALLSILLGASETLGWMELLAE